MVRNVQKWSETFRNGQERSEMVRNVQKWSGTFRNSQERSEMARNVQKCQERSEMARNVQNGHTVQDKRSKNFAKSRTVHASKTKESL